MSSASNQGTSVERSDPPPAIRWRVWPLRDDPVRSVMVMAGLAAAGLAVHWLTGQLHLALLALAMLLVALWRFFLPVAFELNVQGVVQRLFGRQRRIPWRAIRRYEVCSAGVQLLPHADRCAMDAVRGLYLPWGDRREEVLAQVEHYLRPPE